MLFNNLFLFFILFIPVNFYILIGYNACLPKFDPHLTIQILLSKILKIEILNISLK
jgi:hypothetical protein